MNLLCRFRIKLSGGDNLSYKKKLLVRLAVDLDVPEGEYEGRYRTRIEEVGERNLSVGAPFENGGVVSLRKGTKLKLTFYDETGAYSFQTQIMQRIEVPVTMFVLELPDSVTKVQRRSFVRVPAMYPVTFRSVTNEGLSDFHKARMLDLSGGGIRFQTAVRVEKKSLLYTQLTLPDGDLQTPVRVCRAEKIEDSKEYMVSVEFHDLLERERDRIIRCVFEIQRNIRNKGLI